jgi:hypothetical protein
MIAALHVTMGLMNFINLAHGAFAMFGGYFARWLMRRWEVPFVGSLPLVLVALAAAGVIEVHRPGLAALAAGLDLTPRNRAFDEHCWGVAADRAELLSAEPDMSAARPRTAAGTLHRVLERRGPASGVCR